MTDKAVSALTSLTGANTATGDLLYIVDISEAAAADRSKKITAEELQNYVKKFPATIGVGGATPAASGAGISFPATASASSDGNTLDDYEEGTWNPALRGSGTAGTFTLSASTATYTKIGNMMTLYCAITVSSVSGSPTGDFQITGLPAAVAAGTSANGAVQAGRLGQSTITGVSFSTRGSSSTLYVTYIDGSNVGQVIQANTVTSSAVIDFCISYPVA